MHYSQLTTRFDSQERVVTLADLQILAESVSGSEEWFEVTRVSKAHVTLNFSNPDEDGGYAYVSVLLPAFRNPAESANPFVLLWVIRAVGGRDAADRNAAVSTIESAVFSAEADT